MVQSLKGEAIKVRVDRERQMARIFHEISSIVTELCTPLHQTYGLMRPVVAMLKVDHALPQPKELSTILDTIKERPSTGEIDDDLEVKHTRLMNSTIKALHVATKEAVALLKGGSTTTGNFDGHKSMQKCF
jgi:hypothetical protein